MYHFELPKDQWPEFPDRCAVCGCEAPGGDAAVMTIAGDSSAPMLRSVGPIQWMRMPVCPICIWSMRQRVWLRILIFWVGFGASLALAWWMSGWPASGERKWLFKAAVYLAWAPWMLVLLGIHLPVELTICDDTLRYTFKSRRFSEDFAALNDVEATDDRSEEEAMLPPDD
ncbi:MAG: hypothetical protein DWQ37_16710 [Planctomycetota bacterium]|nr:MAG: hypothetical protein DWQ37_16710 [Planctomycetota bacterium]